MVLVFAGPNGSGKSSITGFLQPSGLYVNADDIQRANSCSSLEAAQIAEKMRYDAINSGSDLTFETVLSTDRNIKLLEYAKSKGYFIKCFYVLTDSSAVNINRVAAHVLSGGHDVPKEKIINRYDRCMSLVPELIRICDIINVYDNTVMPIRIFSKKKNSYRVWSSPYWSMERILKLTEMDLSHLSYEGEATGFFK